MKVESTLRGLGKEEPEINYPCLMRSVHDGFVVLFNSKGAGTVVSLPTDGSVGYSLGYYISTWCMDSFALLSENYIIELQNKGEN